MNDVKGRKAVLAALLCAGLLLSGCKELFHPEGPAEAPEPPVQYTVTFDVNGGSPATQSRTVTGGASLGEDMPPNPARPLYTFGGWYTAKNGGGSAFTATTLVNGNITVYAQWTGNGPVQCTVTFDADGGSPATQTKPVNDFGIVGTSNMPREPTRTNYAFDGWYTERNGGGTEFYVDMPITGNVTMYAKWTIVQYTITFNADGGSPAAQTRTVNSGAYVGTPNKPSAPAKSGSIFGGWYTERNGGGSQFYVDTVVTGDITVYAKWTLDLSMQRTITFDADGGSPTPAPLMVSSGGSADSNMPADPARSGYVFGGWYTAANGGGTAFTGLTPVNGNMTAYAKWTTIQYTVTFNADGGNPATQSRTVNSGGSTGSAMPADPSRAHYTFGGWYTAPDGGGTAFTASTVVSGNMTVYAKWTIIQYTVSFNADGGSPATQTRTVNNGSSVGSSNMPANPAKSGYVFGGWYTAANGGGTAFTASTVVSGNITVYAQWTIALSLNDALAWISTNATEGGAYTVTLTRDETIAPKTLSYSGKNVSVTIKGDAAKRTVNLSSNGALFTVESGVTLTLDNNIVLRGRSDNNTSLVRVNDGGKLVMNAGSEISGNNTANSSGGGVAILSSGTFTMNGGTISDNTASSSSYPYYSYGGGVLAAGALFTMSGGTISGNTASFRGGGVCLYAGTFTMSGGIISGNSAAYGGGGVYVSGGTFTKQSGGIIYGSNAGNTLKNTVGVGRGPAVYVYTGLTTYIKRDTTAGVGVTMDSTKDGAAGGWE